MSDSLWARHEEPSEAEQLRRQIHLLAGGLTAHANSVALVAVQASKLAAMARQIERDVENADRTPIEENHDVNKSV